MLVLIIRQLPLGLPLTGSCLVAPEDQDPNLLAELLADRLLNTSKSSVDVKPDEHHPASETGHW